jgi:uncharacterized protein (TIGR01777 family)
MSGASGLIGSALVPFLSAAGHRVQPLVRSPHTPAEPAIYWNPEQEQVDSRALEGFDVAIHLAGRSIAESRWTAAQKQRLINSRVLGTRLLSTRLAALSHPPRTLIVASAIGYYGDRGDERLTEDSLPGHDFLSGLVQQWEAATLPAAERGLRVVRLRLGIVLSPRGGALKEMMLPFRFGVGGPLGSGRQYFSWITLADVVQCVRHIIENEEIAGPINVVAPEAVRQSELAAALGQALHRPAWIAVPRWALGIKLGFEMADSLLASTRVVPDRLLKSGFEWQDREIGPALRRILTEAS